MKWSEYDTYNYWYPKNHIMQIEVTGHRSKKIKEIVYRAVEYYCTLLLDKRRAKSLWIEVELKNRLDNDAEGYCFYEGYDRGNRDFTIQIAKHFKLENILKNIAHECVHLKQFAKGELKDNFNRSSFWMGKKFDDQAHDYYDLPWEIEAFGREQGLYYKFLRDNPIDKSLLNKFI